MENDHRTMEGPAYDTIRANLLMHYQDRVWEMVRHVSTIELATLAAWYYLFDRDDYLLSAMLLIVSSLFVSLFYLTILRYVYLASCANGSLNTQRKIYLGIQPKGMEVSRKLKGFGMAKYLPIAVFLVNLFLIGMSLFPIIR